MVVGHRDRLARWGVGLLEAVWSGRGRRMMVVGSGETTEDLVGERIGVLTTLCARRYGCGGAWDRALRAVAAKRERGAGA